MYASWEDDTELHLLMPYALGGDLYNKTLGAGKRMMEQRCAAWVVRPVLEGLAFLHKNGIIHRDIKLENIFVASDGNVRLADYGFSIDVEEERPSTRLGTLGYMSPEILKTVGKGRAAPAGKGERASLYGKKVEGRSDVWGQSRAHMLDRCGFAPEVHHPE